VTCRTCGATIDAKAIICYRCGAPTADAQALRTPPGGRRISNARIIVVILAVVALIVYFAYRSATGG